MIIYFPFDINYKNNKLLYQFYYFKLYIIQLQFPILLMMIIIIERNQNNIKITKKVKNYYYFL